MEGSGNYVIFLLLHYSFLINFVAGSKTVKFIVRYFVELHCLCGFLVVATVDSGFRSCSGLGTVFSGFSPKKKERKGRLTRPVPSVTPSQGRGISYRDAPFLNVWKFRRGGELYRSRLTKKNPRCPLPPYVLRDWFAHSPLPRQAVPQL